jgi:hypothetical protein
MTEDTNIPATEPVTTPEPETTEETATPEVTEEAAPEAPAAE